MRWACCAISGWKTDRPGRRAALLSCPGQLNWMLRTRDDRAALEAAILDGTLSCFATDHAPHSADKKARGGDVRFVLLAGPGEWTVRAVDEDVLAASLARWCARG